MSFLDDSLDFVPYIVNPVRDVAGYKAAWCNELRDIADITLRDSKAVFELLRRRCYDVDGLESILISAKLVRRWSEMLASYNNRNAGSIKLYQVAEAAGKLIRLHDDIAEGRDGGIDGNRFDAISSAFLVFKKIQETDIPADIMKEMLADQFPLSIA